MAQAYGGIQPVQVANLPPTAATPGPVEGALDADEPMPLRSLLCREDTHIGQVQRHLNDVVHRDSSRSEPVPLSSHRDAPSGYDNMWFVTGIPGEPKKLELPFSLIFTPETSPAIRLVFCPSITHTHR